MRSQSKRPDDLEMAEREQVFRRFVAVQLNDLETKVFREIGHFAGGPVDEDSHGGNRAAAERR